MEVVRRLLLTVGLLWFLIVSNPSPSSFRRYARDIHQDSRPSGVACDQTNACVYFARALEPANSYIKTYLSRPFTSPVSESSLFFGVDCFFFSVVYTHTIPPRVFLGIANSWLPVPIPPPIPVQETLRGLVGSISAGSLFPQGGPTIEDFESFREKLLPERPWEVLMALFALTGAYSLLFPEDARKHFALSWHNMKHARRWWCLILFHFSHGNSFLRLCRTVATFNYMAPLLLQRRILTLSGLYGVVLTGGAVSGMLCVLVLVRRNVNASSQGVPRPSVDIYGGGGCVYALLVAACLSTEKATIPLAGGIRPFELLMLNVAFDAVFLAGDSADYTAHAGAALGSWLFCALGSMDSVTRG